MQIGGDNGLAADYRSFALKRAAQFGVFLSPPGLFEDDGVFPPLIAGSLFQAAPATNAGSAAALPTESGGVWRIASAGTNNAFFSIGAGAGTFIAGTKPGMIDDPGVAGSRWYLLAAMRVSSAVDNKTSLQIGFRPANNTANNTINIGVDGQFVSTTKLMAEENVLNTTTSSVDIGAPSTWHYLEAWQVGVANQVFFSFDSEAPKILTLTASFGGKGMLYATAGNGSTLTARSLDIDHLVLLMPSSTVLPII